MTALNGSLLSISDAIKRTDPDNKIAKVIELLDKTNSLTKDMVWVQGNLPTGHRTTVRTSIPTPSWRNLNEGVAKTKSTTAQVDEACGILEDRSEVDVELVNLNGGSMDFRLSEAVAHLEGMNQEMESTSFYGNTTTAPNEFNGLATRYDSSSSGEEKQNVLSAGGSDAGDQTSVWLVCWGENTVHGIYPKGSTAGLTHEDLGIGDAFDGSNNRFRAYMDRFVWKCGLAVRDWRYVVRIANIDMSNLIAQSSDADLTKYMTKALYRIPNLGSGRPVFYMTRTVLQMLDIQRQAAVGQGGGITFANVDGQNRPTFRGIPIQISDSILETENAV